MMLLVVGRADVTATVADVAVANAADDALLV